MKANDLFVKLFAAAIAVSLLKLAFFPSDHQTALQLVSPAQAGAAVEWKEAKRILTTNEDGSTTYVWDYEDRTKVRKYSVSGNKLTLETYKLEE
jgi:hypothetical protein